MVLMAAACLPCVVAVWRRAHDRGVRLLFVMALAMVAVHAIVLLAPASQTGHVHGGVGSMDSMGAAGGGGMAPAVPQAASMLGVIALELAVAMLAAWVMRRERACRGPETR